MSNILVVVGSSRPGRVSEKVLELTKEVLAKHESVTYEVADLKDLALPFFDNERSPNDPAYEIINPQVQQWAELVQGSDTVLFITPEYNHSLSAIQKNAIDSLGESYWGDKPVSAVAYGWGGGALSITALREIMGNVKAKVQATPAQLAFMKDLNPDGSVLDAASVEAQITAAITELV